MRQHLLLCLLACLPCGANAGAWIISHVPAGCDTACTANGGTCDAASIAEMKTITNEAAWDAAWSEVTTMNIAHNAANTHNGGDPIGWFNGLAANQISGAPHGNLQNYIPYMRYQTTSGQKRWGSGGGDPACPGNFADPGSYRMCYCSGISVPTGGVSGDPVTVVNGVEYKFTIPIGQLTTLIQTKDLVIRASAFAGDKGDEQWIDRVVVETSLGEPLAEVQILHDIVHFDRNQKSPSSLETLDISLPWQQSGVLTFPTHDESHKTVRWGKFIFAGAPFAHLSGVTVDLFRLDDPSTMSRYIPCREGVLITAKSMTLAIVSASAFEYYWDDTDNWRACKYAHLDMEFLDAKEVHSWIGLLPELWKSGRKNSTGSMISAPSPAPSATSKTQELIVAQGSRSASESKPVLSKRTTNRDERHNINRQILVDLLSTEELDSSRRTAICGGNTCLPEQIRV